MTVKRVLKAVTVADMNRRTFLKWLGIGAATVAVNPQSLLEIDKPRGKRVVVGEGDEWRHTRVFHKGKDISDTCFGVDTGEGWADVYLEDENSKKYYDFERDCAANTRIYGKFYTIDMRDYT